MSSSAYAMHSWSMPAPSTTQRSVSSSILREFQHPLLSLSPIRLVATRHGSTRPFPLLRLVLHLPTRTGKVAPRVTFVEAAITEEDFQGSEEVNSEPRLYVLIRAQPETYMCTPKTEVPLSRHMYAKPCPNTTCMYSICTLRPLPTRLHPQVSQPWLPVVEEAWMTLPIWATCC